MKRKKRYPHKRPGEEFRKIPGLKNYLISNQGRVWSFSHRKFIRPDNNGKAIHLYQDNIQHSYTLHLLIEDIFEPEKAAARPKSGTPGRPRKDTAAERRTPEKKELEPPRPGEEFMPIYLTPMYMISDQGRVWSNYSKKILLPHDVTRHNKNGTDITYKRIFLRINGHNQGFYIHRLMAYSFHIKGSYAAYIARKHDIHHIDGDGTNNDVKNLMRCTPSEHKLEHHKDRKTE